MSVLSMCCRYEDASVPLVDRGADQYNSEAPLPLVNWASECSSQRPSATEKVDAPLLDPDAKVDTLSVEAPPARNGADAKAALLSVEALAESSRTSHQFLLSSADTSPGSATCSRRLDGQRVRFSEKAPAEVEIPPSDHAATPNSDGIPGGTPTLLAPPESPQWKMYSSVNSGAESRASRDSASTTRAPKVSSRSSRGSLASRTTSSWRVGSRSSQKLRLEEMPISPELNRKLSLARTSSMTGSTTVTASTTSTASMLRVVPQILSGVRRLRGAITAPRQPSQLERERGVQIERVYDLFDFQEKCIRVRRMEDFVFHHRPVNDDEDEEDYELSSSSSGSSGSSSCSSSEAKQVGGVSRRKRGGKGSRSLNELITRWAVLAGRLMHNHHFLDIRQVADRYHSRRLYINQFGKPANQSRMFQSTRAKARLVVKQAWKLARHINREEEDCLDTEWARSSERGFLSQLFGNEYVDVLALLANTAYKIVSVQPSLVEASAPCKVYGDIHGQLRDLLLLLRAFGSPDTRDAPTFVFNGDFVDRGAHQLEVIGLLLAYKVLLPEKVWLVRGNHECRCMNDRYGFAAECHERLGQFGPKLYSLIHRVFDHLPVACLISKRVLVVHGGIGDGAWRVDDIHGIRRPLGDEMMSDPEKSWIVNLLWSDPIEDDDARHNVFGVHQSPRGENATRFGWNVTKTFCARNGLSLIVRSHQSKMGSLGFDIMHENLLMRVFSARDYEGHRNDGAVLAIRAADPEAPQGLLVVRPQVLRSAAKGKDGTAGERRHSAG